MNNIFFYGALLVALAVTIPAVASAAVKLPYQIGQEFVVVQGYNSPPTHINKDADAIDFSQNGCDAYGKVVAASAGGVVELAEEYGYNGGYGTQVLIDEGNHIVARYAHMIPGSISLAVGTTVVQGQPLGAIGNTGLVAGAACGVHPGTHLHFAMYYQNTDASFAAYSPEPISGYSSITEGRWYLSDNSPVAPAATSATATTMTTTAPFATQFTPLPVSEPPVAPAPVSSTVSISLSPTPLASTISFNSSTLAIDLSWEAASTTEATIYKIDPANASNTFELATTTAANYSYVLQPTDFGTSIFFEIALIDSADSSASTVAFASTTAPGWFTTLQPVDTENSNGSWYDDNWYDLGTGFYGLVKSLTFKGFIDRSNYSTSHLWLDEYIDQNYTELNQTFTISDDAPFTDGMQMVTIGGLDIPLQSNKFYRLRTYENFQNESVILAGTTATGTAMWNEFIYGTGRVENQYTFYPYIAAVMVPNYPPPASPNPPADATTSLDLANSILNFSWSPATDPDTTSSLLTYQFNVVTSTVGIASPPFDSSAWQSVGKSFSANTPVVFGDSYMIGVRAVDDFGNIGQPVVVTWNFPAGYAPVPKQLDHSVGLEGGTGSAQEIGFIVTSTINGIYLWTNPGGGPYCCSEAFVSVHADASGTPGAVIATTDPVQMYDVEHPGERFYGFDTPVTLPADEYWFSLDKESGNWNDTGVYGSLDDSYSGGEWSTAPGQDAYFRIAE